MRILCLFGFHDWGKQTRVRDGKYEDSLLLFTPIFFLSQLFGPPRVCDRECLRCGKVKEFSYDSQRG